MIGVDALAAVSVFFPVMFFLISFIIGLGSGATVLIGQAWGAASIDKVKRSPARRSRSALLLGAGGRAVRRPVHARN